LREAVKVTICVGSSCHVKGARDVIERFQALLAEAPEADVELEGSFCMERCGDGLNWLIDGQPVTSMDVDEAVATFTKEVLGR
jgi:NADH:ubiquinone oxidoreductase subunit E